MTPDQLATNLADAIFDEWDGVSRDTLIDIIRTHGRVSGADNAFEETRRALALLERARGVTPPVALDARSWIKAVRS